MKAKSIEIVGTLIEERRPSGCGTFFLGKIRPVLDGEVCSQIVNIVGNAEEDDLKLHMTYRWYGEWKKHEKYGDQFAFSTFGAHKPLGRTGVVKYLQECPHIGEPTAIQLWNLFNSDAVRICRTAPELVAEKVPRLTLAKCQEIASKLKEMSAIENLSIEAMDLFTGRGFPKKTAQYAIKAWGAKAIEIVSRDPFKLSRFRGIGFKKCDSMWQDLGLPLNKLKRQVYCILHAIESGTNGDVWYSADKIKQTLQNSMPAGVEVDFDRAVKLAIRAKMLSEKLWCDKCDNTGTTEQPDLFFGDEMIQGPCPVCEFGKHTPQWLAIRGEAEAEDYIARHLVDALKETPRWPVLEETPEGQVGPSKHQIEELRKALTSTLCILHGSPGTGKTFTFGYLAKAIIAQFGENSIAGAAPTGIAAQRMREALSAAGCNVVVKTHHGLLGVEEADDGGLWVFKHNERKPLPYQFLFLDEQSMDDAMIFASLLKARAKGTHILFIGDTNQLPPVGSGAPLRDMMKAGIACGNLTEIRRNAGTIVRACAQIREGKPFDIDKDFDLNPVCPDCENESELHAGGCGTCGGTGKLPPKNLILVTAGRSQAPAAVYSTVAKLKEQGIDPVWQAQAIIAVNKKSPLARTTVNTRLQEMLNPGGKTVPNTPFRTSDKVICLKNSMFKKHGESGEDAIKYPIANGELGKVLEVAEKLTVIESFNPKRVYDVFRNASAAKKPESDEADEKDDTSSSTGCDIELAYAITSHKSQGAQFDYVIVALDEYPGAVGPRGICKREWLYTAISRAKIGCILVGLRSTALAMIAETALDKRKTFLAELIKQYRKEDQHWQKKTLEGTCETVTTTESTESLPPKPKKPVRVNWMAMGAFNVTNPMT